MRISCIYVAGLFDGEGWVGNYYNAAKHHRAIVAAIGNSYKPVLDAIQQRWGGGVYLHPGNSRFKEAKPFWTWRLNGKATVPFFKAIIPHLREKRERAETALAVALTLGKSGRPKGSKDSYPRTRKVA